MQADSLTGDGPVRASLRWRRTAALLATSALVAAAALTAGAARAQQGPFVYVPNGGDNDISRIDIPTNTVQGGTIPVGNDPVYAAVRGDQSLVYVANALSNTVSVIDTGTNTVTETIAVGTTPVAVAVSPDGHRVYVANNNSNNLSVIDADTNSVTATIPIGVNPSEPSSVVVSPDSKTVYVYYLDFGSKVAIIDASTNAVVGTVTLGASQPWGMAISPNGSRLYLTDPDNSRVFVVDTTTRNIVATIAGVPGNGVAVSPDGGRVYVANFAPSTDVTVIDTSTNTVVATVNVGAATDGVAFSPDGSRVYVTANNGNTVSVIDTATNFVIANLIVGNNPADLGSCGNGNALLAAGNTFVAKQSSATVCTGVTGPIFTGGTMHMAGAVFASDLSVNVLAQGGTITGDMAGAGGLIKNGPGALTLGDASSYTGATTVNAGTLVVNGSIASSSMTTVNAGGTLAGSGTVGNTTINGGTLSPGSSIGTINIAGNLVTTAASTYLVEVSPTSADRTNVTGTANLAGTVHAVFQPGSYVARTYTILSPAGGRDGGTNFGALTTTNLPANFTASLSYSGNDVLLNLTAALGIGSSLNRNQQNVADVHNNFFNSGGTLPPDFVALFGLTGAPLGHALAQLSGETATGIQPASHLSMSLFLNAMLDPSMSGRDGGLGAAMGYAPEAPMRAHPTAQSAFATVAKAPAFAQRWSVWGSAYGGRNRTGSDEVAGSNDLIASTGGFAAGADYRVSPDTVVGTAIAIGQTRWNVSGLGKGDAEVAQVGGFASTRWNTLYLSIAAAGAWYPTRTDRTVTVSGADRLEADFDATSFGARFESGRRYQMTGYGVTPYAAVQVQSLRTPAYSERATSGSEIFALSYPAQTTTGTRSELGAWVDTRGHLADGKTFTLRGRAAWVHDFDPGSRISAAFQTVPGASFTVDGAAAPRNAALTSVVAELKLSNGVTLIGKFDGEFSGRAYTYAGTGTVKYAW